MSRVTAKKVGKLISKLEKIKSEIDKMLSAERAALPPGEGDEIIEHAIDQLEMANSEIEEAMCSLTESLQND